METECLVRRFYCDAKENCQFAEVSYEKIEGWFDGKVY